jgi:hypothetical protein
MKELKLWELEQFSDNRVKAYQEEEHLVGDKLSNYIRKVPCRVTTWNSRTISLSVSKDNNHLLLLQLMKNELMRWNILDHWIFRIGTKNEI